MKASIAVLLASLSDCGRQLGGRVRQQRQLKEISNVFSLLGVIGSVVIAWLGKSPIKPKD